MTTEQKYNKLVGSYESYLKGGDANQKGIFVKGASKQAFHRNRDLFVLSAAKFAESPSSATHWAHQVCTEMLLTSAMDRYASTGDVS